MARVARTAAQMWLYPMVEYQRSLLTPFSMWAAGAANANAMPPIQVELSNPATTTRTSVASSNMFACCASRAISNIAITTEIRKRIFPPKKAS